MNNPVNHKSVQMRRDNYDIKNNPKVREKYPLLYAEVLAHDRDSGSSWYDLSMKAYWEYLEYMDDKDICYVS